MPRSITIAALGMVLGATLAGCNTSPPAMPPPSAAVAPPPAGSANAPPVSATPPSQPMAIDGIYRGAMQLSRGRAINCGNDDAITLRVKNHAFTYRLQQPQADWRPTIDFVAKVAPDGSFNAKSGPDSISGQIADGVMQGTIIGDICGFSFNAGRG